MITKRPASAGDVGSISGLARFPEVGNGNQLQCSYPGSLTDRGSWRATAHRVPKQLDANEHAHKNTDNKNLSNKTSEVLI